MQTARIQLEHSVPAARRYVSDRCERSTKFALKRRLVQTSSNDLCVCQDLGGGRVDVGGGGVCVGGEGAPNMLCAPGSVQQVQSTEKQPGMFSRDQKKPR